MLLLLEALPFSAIKIMFLLSWYIDVVSRYSPCAARKWHVHSICPIASLILCFSGALHVLLLFRGSTVCNILT